MRDPRPAPHGTAPHRTALIDAMRRVALSKGFPGTTVDEICHLAGVTKGSFYHHFASKEELGVAALEGYFDDVVTAFTTGAWTQIDDPVLRLHGFVANAAEASVGPVMTYGCLIGSFALDLAESSPNMRVRLAEMFTALRVFVADLVTVAAAHRGRVVDAERLGDQFLAVVEGSIVLAKAHADPSVPHRGITLFGEHLDLLLG